MTESTPTRPTYARIDLDNLAFNFHSVRNFVGRDVRFMAVVKANAYGHGSVECARRLEREGVDWFAVATLEEATELRGSGVVKPILCLGGFYPGQEGAGLRLKITPAVTTLEGAERIDRAAAARGLKADVHVKIDTGMGRVGVPFADLNEFVDRLSGLQNLDVRAVMTHFASADDVAENEFTDSQIDQLNTAVSIFRDRGFRPEFVDMANSPGAVAHPSSRADLVRIGGILFGLGRDVLPDGVTKPEIKPVLSLHTRLSQIKRVPSGTGIGYGRTFVTTRESVIGTIPIGYHDGYRRELSNRGRAIVNGAVAPVAGRISMDWVTLDLTEIPVAAVGDEVTLIGSTGGHAIVAEDLAAEVGTISYEITCGISERVERRYAGNDRTA
jgi:alanine racemase